MYVCMYMSLCVWYMHVEFQMTVYTVQKASPLVYLYGLGHKDHPGGFAVGEEAWGLHQQTSF